jgi:hypothetical protein
MGNHVRLLQLAHPLDERATARMCPLDPDAARLPINRRRRSARSACLHFAWSPRDIAHFATHLSTERGCRAGRQAVFPRHGPAWRPSLGCAKAPSG